LVSVSISNAFRNDADFVSVRVLLLRTWVRGRSVVR